MSKPIVICGEASETDSEDEENIKAISKSVHGAVIPGEDSESENDVDISISSAVSALNPVNLNPQEKLTENHTFNSLFHQKLRECNSQLCKDIENYTQHQVNEAGKTLNTTDQQLLKSQITLQNAVTSLKSLSVNSLMIKSKLHSLLSANFLSTVNVNKFINKEV